ncbi:MAG: polysaccharide deacetylase family protein [Bacillota bacterium]|jgi:hypothetical protein|nr:polysaccharide deacetylase family protein [Candidatus Fermentithermobacillaceae bacterium]
MNSVQPNHELSRRRSRRPWASVGSLIAVCALSIAVLLVAKPFGFTVLPRPANGHDPVGESDQVNEAGQYAPRQLSPLEEQRAARLSQAAERPNELGTVPIIMYHVIGEPESEWVRTPDNFRRDLERFYQLGYSLVPLQAYLKGELDLPAGVSPLVITFDDATIGQLRLITEECEHSETGISLERKVPDPDSAVGILLEFSRQRPGFGHSATFFVDFPAPFEVPDEVVDKLELLLEWGMEIGNHTYNHRDLRDATADVIQTELGRLSAEIEKLTGQRPLSLALPYGSYPRDPANKQYLLAGEYQGIPYENLGVLLVGAEPAPSPYHQGFNRAAIPRIRGSEEELSKWLNYLESSGTRYVSDGNPDTIAIPEGRQDEIADTFAGIYELVVLPEQADTSP